MGCRIAFQLFIYYLIKGCKWLFVFNNSTYWYRNLRLIPEYPLFPVLTTSKVFRFLIDGSLAFVSLKHTWSASGGPFTLTHTTMTLYHSSLGQFEVFSWKAILEGLSSSFVYLQIKLFVRGTPRDVVFLMYTSPRTHRQRQLH